VLRQKKSAVIKQTSNSAIVERETALHGFLYSCEVRF